MKKKHADFDANPYYMYHIKTKNQPFSFVMKTILIPPFDKRNCMVYYWILGIDILFFYAFIPIFLILGANLFVRSA